VSALTRPDFIVDTAYNEKPYLGDVFKISKYFCSSANDLLYTTEFQIPS
jgi:hypothetical protein